MGTKKTNFNKTGIGKLPNDKPVLYKIQIPRNQVPGLHIAKQGFAVQ